MARLFWDASALSKRYYEEEGSATVDAIFAATSPYLSDMTYVGYAETAAILRRKLNRGEIDFPNFQQARLLLETEVLLDGGFGLLSVNDRDVLTGISLTDLHNINSTDAALLATYLRYAQALPPTAPRSLLIAADRRLIRAAEAEGLRTLNPELLSAADIPSLLADQP